MGIPIIGDLVNGAAKIIDEFHTSDQEKLEAKRKLTELQMKVSAQALDYEATRQKEAGATIRAEAQSDSWLARSWRPLMMLMFASMLVLHWFGWTSPNLSQEEILGLFDLIKIGLGGYVIGRSAEKIIPSSIAAFKKADKVEK